MASDETSAKASNRAQVTPAPLNNQEFKSWLNEKCKKFSPNKQYRKEGLEGYLDPEEDDTEAINLSNLEDPPKSFQINGVTPRRPEMGDAIALMRHHFWNIYLDTIPRNAEDRMKAFRKLAWNQDEKHRVTDFSHLRDMRRDAGPRLLKPEILKKLRKSPISRRYPDFPAGSDWEAQRARSVELKESEEAAPTPIDGVAASGPRELYREETPPNLQIVQELLERLLIQLRYQHLEVTTARADGNQIYTVFDTSEASRRKHLPAHDIDLTLSVHHEPEPKRYNSSGKLYKWREKGPVAGKEALYPETKFDCIMMAGKLLDAGITNIDMAANQSDAVQTSMIHQEFVAMVRNDWKQDDASQARARYAVLLSDLQAKNFRHLLEESTFLRPQFKHTETVVRKCDDDHESTQNPITKSLMCMDKRWPSPDGSSYSMEQVLQDMFPQYMPDNLSDKQKSCTVKDCKGNIIERKIRRTMPLRMAVSLSSQLSPVNHMSDNIRIKFFDDLDNGNEDVAVYRWLGGIYANDSAETSNIRYRIYWTESLKGGSPSSTLTMYDPLNADGRVVEGISPIQNDKRIPSSWWDRRFKPVLFYERVFNPHPHDITLAAAVLGDIKDASDHKNYVLQHPRQYWNPVPPPNDDQGGANGHGPSHSRHTGSGSISVVPNQSSNTNIGVFDIEAGFESIRSLSVSVPQNGVGNGTENLNSDLGYQFPLNASGSALPTAPQMFPQSTTPFIPFENMQQPVQDIQQNILASQFTDPSAQTIPSAGGFMPVDPGMQDYGSVMPEHGNWAPSVTQGSSTGVSGEDDFLGHANDLEWLTQGSSFSTGQHDVNADIQALFNHQMQNLSRNPNSNQQGAYVVPPALRYPWAEARPKPNRQQGRQPKPRGWL